MKYIILSLSLLVIFPSCSKSRACECKNANATYSAGEIEGTKRQAKKKCESLSTSTTECRLK
jgi:hypothetical protein